jgi:hypothetical protein
VEHASSRRDDSNTSKTNYPWLNVVGDAYHARCLLAVFSRRRANSITLHYS